MAKQYNIEQKADETLEQWYRRLAKVADQRMVNLEKLSKQQYYKGVEAYAYSRAIRDIKQWSGTDRKRFNTKPPENKQQLQAKINDIKTFLEAPTSTKSGITDIYVRRAKTTNETYGTDFTWKELANFYESGEAEKLDSSFGSKTLVRALGAIKHSGIKPDDIQAVIDSKKKVAKDDIVNEVAIRLLKQGYTADELFN